MENNARMPMQPKSVLSRYPLFASFQGRLYLLLFSVFIPVLLIQAGYLYQRFETRKANEFRTNMEMARAVTGTFNQFVKDILNQELAIGVNFTMPQSLPPDQMNRILATNRAAHSALRSFFWLDPEGIIIASSNGSSIQMDLSDRNYVRKIISGEKWVVSDLIISRATGEPIFTISRAIRGNEGKLLGIIVAGVSADKMGDVISLELSKDETITILDSTGTAVYQYPAREWTLEERDLLKNRPAIRQALDGREVTGIFPCFTTGDERVVALSPIPSIGWVASIGRSQKALMAPIISQIIHQAGIFSLLLIAVFLGAYTLSRGIAGSIRRLWEGALALGGGNLGNRIEVSGPGELKDLASAFNAMAEKIGTREKALENAHQRLESVLEAIPACISLQARDYSVRYSNRTYLETFGDHDGKPCYEHLVGRGEPCDFCTIANAFDTQTPQHWEWTSPGGQCFMAHAHPFTDLDGAPMMLKLSIEISELKQAQKDLRESEEKYRELVESANSIIIRMDARGTMTFVNEFAQKFYGYTEEEFMGRNPIGLFRPEQDCAGRELAAVFDDIFHHPEMCANTEGENIRKNGEKVWVSWTNRAILDEDGQVCGILSIGNDITDRKRVRDALQESERQLRFLSSKLLSAHEEERKRIAGELHDSLGSALSAVKLSLENARQQSQGQKSLAAALDLSISWTQHAMDEARRLMTDLRPAMLDDLGLVMTIGWFSRQHRKLHPSIHIEEDIDIEEPDIPDHLKIVIFRIMQEAFHNISKYSRAEFVSLSIAKNNGAIELVIEDNGDGFDVESALRTKDGRRGMGLTGMKERAELSGGSFAISSVLGEGSTIRASWTSAGKDPPL